MGTGEKKIKQSILCVAFILLICGFNSAHKSTDIRQLKDANPKTEILHPGIDNKEQQDKASYENIELNKNRNYIFFHSPSQNFVTKSNPIIFLTQEQMEK